MGIDVMSDAVEIARPSAEVAAYAFDPANDPTWIGGIREVELVSAPPFGVGSRVRRVATFMGRDIRYLMEVADLQPGARLRMHAIESPFPMDVTYDLEPVAGGARTRARIRVQGDAKGYYRLAGPLLPGMVKRSITSDLRALKRVTEARSAA